MKIRISELRKVIREVLTESQTIFYHGTLRERLPGIMSTGLNPGYGWGAEKPGVFLSATPDNGLYWAKMSHITKSNPGVEKKHVSMFDPSAGDEVAVLKITIPATDAVNLVKRETSFSLPGDMQYLGSIPPEWIEVIK